MLKNILRKIDHRLFLFKVNFDKHASVFIDNIYFKDKKTPFAAQNSRRKINFFAIAWKENPQLNNIDLFFLYTFPSIMQPGNIPALKAVGYPMEFFLYTKTEEDIRSIKAYGEKLKQLEKYMPVKIIQIPVEKGLHRIRVLSTALLEHFEVSYREGAWVFMVGGDEVFGNHSMANALKLVEGKNVSLAAAHPRVNAETISSSDKIQRLSRGETTVENDELVDLAFKYAHSSLVHSFDNRDENATHNGLSLRPITEDTYAAVMNLPGVILLSLTKEDVDFFKQVPNFNNLDKGWSRRLYRDNRVKVIGSSEFYFTVELTEMDRATDLAKNKLNNDKYLEPGQRMANNFICNAFYCIWKRKKSGATAQEAVK